MPGESREPETRPFRNWRQLHPIGPDLCGIPLIEVPLERFGFKRRRSLMVERSPTNVALIPEDVLQPGARRRSIGCESESPLITSESAIRLALGPEGGTQIDECVDVIRVERQ